MRAFVQGGDIAATVQQREGARARCIRSPPRANPPTQKFVNISGMQINTVHANDFHFYEELNDVVQHEPDELPRIRKSWALFASIGIKKGKPFAPDARMKAILTDAVAVGNATSRAMTFASRDPLTRYYPDRHWITTFTRLQPRVLDGGERDCWMRARCSSTTSPA